MDFSKEHWYCENCESWITYGVEHRCDGFDYEIRDLPVDLINDYDELVKAIGDLTAVLQKQTDKIIKAIEKVSAT